MQNLNHIHPKAMNTEKPRHFAAHTAVRARGASLRHFPSIPPPSAHLHASVNTLRVTKKKPKKKHCWVAAAAGADMD